MSKMSSNVRDSVTNSGNFLNIPFTPKPLTPGILSELSPNSVLYRIKFSDKQPNFSFTVFGV